jgi:predicted glycogen debranching enzyme
VSFDAGAEWLEADGLGGFASGTVSGVRTRRYHALLCCARTPPTTRMVLVNGIEAWVEVGAQRIPLTTQYYEPGVVHPDGHTRLAGFASTPWPTWRWVLPTQQGEVAIEQELLVPWRRPMTVMTWTVHASVPVTLHVRPLVSGRDYHHMHHENDSMNAWGFESAADGGRKIVYRLYPGIPEIELLTDGQYQNQREWYRRFRYEKEAYRGLDCLEDLASPGVFSWKMRPGERTEARMIMRASTPTGPVEYEVAGSVAQRVKAFKDRELARRTKEGEGLERAARDYLVTRGLSTTIIAGYPWFTDWGRDTFISLRGLCLATGRLEEARQILTDWARYRVEGMLPNRFPDAGASPEFHSVDAGLWYITAAYDFLLTAKAKRFEVSKGDERSIVDTCAALVEGCMQGTRHGIRMDPADGLLSAGVEGTALTWMDARYDGRAVTPRIGKPVEIQALWINALSLVAGKTKKLHQLRDKAAESFVARFWNAERGYLADVVDVNHKPGRDDWSVRPNALFAIGGLRDVLLPLEIATLVVDKAERELWTPMGMRTLAPSEPAYHARYGGPPDARDESYHQGTAWPWLNGPFVEAWVRVRGGTAEAKNEARRRFLDPMLNQPDRGGVGHIAEIADADEPFHSRGCPWQAWSVAEALRLDKVVLA